METLRVLTVTPPGSMRRVVATLRKELYVRWGCVSALALPQVIPLRSWPLRIEAAEAAGLLASCARALSFELASYENVAGNLYLAVRCEGIDLLDRDLEEAIRGVGPDEPGVPAPLASGQALFPAHRGFFLAGADFAATPEELERSLPIPEERRFGSYDLAVLCVRSHAPVERWWDLVSWEEEVCVPVKRSGRPAPGSAARRPRPTGGSRAPGP